MIKLDLFQGHRVVQHMQINHCDTPHQKKRQNHMIISIETEKAFHKIKHSFMIKKKCCQSVGRKKISEHNKSYL